MRKLFAHRSLAAVIGGLMVFSAAYAAAASLGVTSTNLAAGTVSVAACDSAVSTSYSVSYDATATKYVVDSVTVSGIADACFDQDFSVSLVGSAGLLGTTAQADVAAASFSGTTPDDRSLTFSFTSASPRVASADVTGIHVSVSD